MQKILGGLVRFRKLVYPANKKLFEKLAKGQKPATLFVTCADSRIDPTLITQTDPGELFICRNAGNIVPAYGDHTGGISATIEYAVLALNVKHIVVCGHSDCGVMKALLDPEKITHMKSVAHWLAYGETARFIVQENYGHLAPNEKLQCIAEQNVVVQMNNLKTHPSVAARLEQGKLSVHGWYYDIKTGEVTIYEKPRRKFVSLRDFLQDQDILSEDMEVMTIRGDEPNGAD
jgi:carbonic anhydrase